ncbi:MAG: YceI family protein [Planctomycetota bacterium]|nr:YceI family protein [Planctomycetota bacterium]
MRRFSSLPPRFAVLLVALLLTAGFALPPADAAEALKGRTYHFGTHDARTTITFVSEADLETIHGVTNKISGEIRTDKTGTRASGSIRAGVAALKTGIALRDEHLRSDQWLDAKKFPWIQLRLVSAVEGKDGKTWDYTADITIKGKTQRFTGKAKIVAIPDRIGKQLGAGSWVRVRTKFDVKLSDFGVVIPQRIGAKVSDIWKIGVELYGTTANPKAKTGARG